MPENMMHHMSVDGTVVRFEKIAEASDNDGFPWRIVAVELVLSPKIAISNELLAARSKCLKLL